MRCVKHIGRSVINWSVDIASALWEVSVIADKPMEHHYQRSFSAAVFPDESQVLY
jgi:hypothetical protein